MTESVPEKILASVSIDLAGITVRFEKLLGDETGKVRLRISSVQKDGSAAGPLTLSEEQLIELLHQARHSGVLSNSFIGKLREKIEI